MSNLADDFCRLWYDQTSTAIVGFDRDCRVIACNAAAEQTLGVKVHSSQGSEVGQALPKEISEELSRACQQAISKKAPRELELTLRKNHEPALELAVRIKPLFDDHGQVAGGVVWAEDISRLHKLERELAAAERISSLGTLAGGVAHHFNNILGGVSTFVDYALATDDPRASRRALKMTAQAADRVAMVTKSLLAFAQKDSGGQDLADLTEVVLTFVSLVEKSLAEKHIELDLQLHPDAVVPVRVDWMHTVLGNFLDNAEDAMPDGGRVEIQLEADEDSVRLRFSDHGQGIKPEVQDHIFEPFYTTKGLTGNGQQAKTGLGLAVVHGLVNEMGGSVQVESRLGVGSSFTISFARPTDDATGKS